MTVKTPSAVLYADLKRFGRISNYEAARLLLSDEPSEGGGPSPRSRVEDRTYLSRQVVNAAPGQLAESSFADFSRSSQAIISRLVAARGNTPDGRAALERHYALDAPGAMLRALEGAGIDANVCRNLRDRIMLRTDVTDYQRLSLLVLLFVVTGCLADPGQAVRHVTDFVERRLRLRPGTSEVELGRGAGCQAAAETTLGLMRVTADGTVLSDVYPLSASPEGTLIGAYACSGPSITDVGPDVSRQHLRITRRGAAWVAEGLASTNGTRLLHPGSDRAFVIEEPRSRRSGSPCPREAAIQPGDTLCLGASTRFLVVRVAGEGRAPEGR